MILLTNLINVKQSCPRKRRVRTKISSWRNKTRFTVKKIEKKKDFEIVLTKAKHSFYSKLREQYHSPAVSHHNSLPPHKQHNLSILATCWIKELYLALCSSLVNLWTSVSETPRLTSELSRGMLRVTLPLLSGAIVILLGRGIVGCVGSVGWCLVVVVESRLVVDIWIYEYLRWGWWP
jgi:hypothetical protein